MDWKTDISLLDSLRDESAAKAWEVFYDRYKDALFRYARKLGLNDADSEEVVQETMIAMMRILPTFIYDRSKKFRNLLLTIAHRKVMHILKSRYRRDQKHQELQQETVSTEAQSYQDNDFEEEDLAQWRQALMESALVELRDQSGINKKSYEVFEALTVRGLSAAEVAAQHDITVNGVYQIKFRIQKKLKCLAERLEQDLN